MAKQVLDEDDVGVAAGIALPDRERKRLKAAVEILKPGDYTTLRKVAPHGALQARLLSNGAVRFYWRYTFDDKTKREPVGIYDPRVPHTQRQPDASGGFSFTAAVVRATELAVRHDEWIARGGYAAYAQAETGTTGVQGERDPGYPTKSEGRSAHELADAGRHDVSLAALLHIYWERLKKRGAPSWADVKRGLTLHVIKAFPELAARDATSITTAECVNIVRRLGDAGKRRTGNKVRSHLRAAFQDATGPEVNPNASEEYLRFQIKTNPMASVEALAGGTRADKRPYERKDLRAYWAAIHDTPGVKGAVLRLHLLMGAPRIQQFARLLNEDIHGTTVVLYDTKGPDPKVLRPYELPLPAPCLADLMALRNTGIFAISLDGGESKISHYTISSWAQEVIGQKLPGFQLKRIRSSAQTLFSELGITEKTSGRIQSHGISGVMNRHYDGYAFRPEKTEALAKFYEAVTGTNLSSKAQGEAGAPAKQRHRLVAGRVKRLQDGKP